MQIKNTKTRLSRQIPSLCDILLPGDVDLSPEIGQRILDEAHFPGQRRTEQTFVLKHVENINRGLWFRSAIAFCEYDGQMYLVNGKHRVTGLVLSKKTLPFSVVVHPCDSMEEVNSIYARYDSVQRTRTSPQVVNAYGLPDRMGVSKTMADAVYRATPLLMSGLRQLYNNDPNSLEDRIRIGLNDLRLDTAMSFRSEAKLFDTAIGEAGGTWKWKKVLMQSNVLAVALVTLKHQPIAAKAFWLGVINDNGLQKGDPRKALVDYLKENGVEHDVMIAGQAWNAFFRKRSLPKITRKGRPDLRILGTPIGEKA